MRAQIIRKAGVQAQVLAAGEAEAMHDQPMLSRWCAADKRFIFTELDWNDPLDAAVALQLVRFRPGDALDA